MFSLNSFFTAMFGIDLGKAVLYLTALSLSIGVLEMTRRALWKAVTKGISFTKTWTGLLESVRKLTESVGQILELLQKGDRRMDSIEKNHNELADSFDDMSKAHKTILKRVEKLETAKKR